MCIRISCASRDLISRCITARKTSDEPPRIHISPGIRTSPVASTGRARTQQTRRHPTDDDRRGLATRHTRPTHSNRGYHERPGEPRTILGQVFAMHRNMKCDTGEARTTPPRPETPSTRSLAHLEVALIVQSHPRKGARLPPATRAISPDNQPLAGEARARAYFSIYLGSRDAR